MGLKNKNKINYLLLTFNHGSYFVATSLYFYSLRGIFQLSSMKWLEEKWLAF
jgi:hypothetical protein